MNFEWNRPQFNYKMALETANNTIEMDKTYASLIRICRLQLKKYKVQHIKKVTQLYDF